MSKGLTAAKTARKTSPKTARCAAADEAVAEASATEAVISEDVEAVAGTTVVDAGAVANTETGATGDETINMWKVVNKASKSRPSTSNTTMATTASTIPMVMATDQSLLRDEAEVGVHEVATGAAEVVVTGAVVAADEAVVEAGAEVDTVASSAMAATKAHHPLLSKSRADMARTRRPEGVHMRVIFMRTHTYTHRPLSSH